MSILSWLNPKNWFKSAAKSSVESAVDGYVTVEKAHELIVGAVNSVVTTGASKIGEDKLRKLSEGMVALGESLTALGKAVNPDGEEGGKVSENELRQILDALNKGFGLCMDEEAITSLREKIKDFVNAKIDAL